LSHRIEMHPNLVFLIFHYQQRGFRRVFGVDRLFLVIPMGAIVLPKSFVIILVLVVQRYRMMGGFGFYLQERFITIQPTLPYVITKKLSHEIRIRGQY
jgi:hypothetical protein